MPEAKVYVGNLDPDATDRDLDKEFARYGKIAHIWIARKPPGKSEEDRAMQRMESDK